MDTKEKIHRFQIRELKGADIVGIALAVIKAVEQAGITVESYGDLRPVDDKENPAVERWRMSFFFKESNLEELKKIANALNGKFWIQITTKEKIGLVINIDGDKTEFLKLIGKTVEEPAGGSSEPSGRGPLFNGNNNPT